MSYKIAQLISDTDYECQERYAVFVHTPFSAKGDSLSRKETFRGNYTSKDFFEEDILEGWQPSKGFIYDEETKKISTVNLYYKDWGHGNSSSSSSAIIYRNDCVNITNCNLGFGIANVGTIHFYRNEVTILIPQSGMATSFNVFARDTWKDDYKDVYKTHDTQDLDEWIKKFISNNIVRKTKIFTILACAHARIEHFTWIYSMYNEEDDNILFLELKNEEKPFLFNYVEKHFDDRIEVGTGYPREINFKNNFLSYHDVERSFIEKIDISSLSVIEIEKVKTEPTFDYNVVFVENPNLSRFKKVFTIKKENGINEIIEIINTNDFECEYKCAIVIGDEVAYAFMKGTEEIFRQIGWFHEKFNWERSQFYNGFPVFPDEHINKNKDFFLSIMDINTPLRSLVFFGVIKKVMAKRYTGKYVQLEKEISNWTLEDKAMALNLLKR